VAKFAAKFGGKKRLLLFQACKPAQKEKKDTKQRNQLTQSSHKKTVNQSITNQIS